MDANKSIKEAVREFIFENFMMGRDPADLKDNGSLLEMNVIDSWGMVEFVTWLEEYFEITIEDEEMCPDNLDSLDKIEAFILGKQSCVTS